MEPFGKLPCNALEEVWVSLRESQGEASLELQVRTPTTSGKTSPLWDREGILLPIDQLPRLLELLTQVREVCINRGYLYESGPGSVVTMQHGESVVLPLQRRTTVARRDPRIPVRVPVECHVVGAEGIPSTRRVSGEIRDISLHGAQVCLPQRLPRLKQVDVAGLLDGGPFQARAQVVNLQSEAHRDPATGLHRHGLQWVAMEPTSRALLTTAIARRSESGPVLPPLHPTAPPGDPGPPVPPEDCPTPPAVSSEVDAEAASSGLFGDTPGSSLLESLERRRATRTTLPQPVPVRVRGQAAQEVRLLDLSLTGARIEHLGAVQPGSPCVLEFPAGRSPLALSARVARSRALGDREDSTGTPQRRYESGLMFVEVTPDQQATLARIVEWLTLGGTAEGLLTSS
jgi:c-di-GMP-binding flagellar brake protein YcgR